MFPNENFTCHCIEGLSTLQIKLRFQINLYPVQCGRVQLGDRRHQGSVYRKRNHSNGGTRQTKNMTRLLESKGFVD